MTAEVTTYCKCVYCEECLLGQFGDVGEACEECGQPTVERNYCDSDCWGMMREDFAYVVGEWIEANNVEQFYIAGRNMGWTRSAGHTGKLSDAMQALAALTGDFDCTLRLAYDQGANTLQVVRYSHDEMGAHFTFTPCAACVYCGDGITYDEDERTYADLGGGTWCGYSPNDQHSEHE